MNYSHLIYDDTFITWATAAAIAIGTFFAAAIVQGFLVKKGGSRAKRSATLLDDLAVDLVKNIKRYFLFFLSIYVGMVWIPLPERIRLLVDKGFMVITMVQVAQLLALLINFWITKHLHEKSSKDPQIASTVGLISIGVKALAYSLLLLLTLNNLGINITALVAGLGVGGVAVALALQNILADLFSSLTIVLDKPFIVGDFIVVNDFMGEVEHIGLKTTRLRSLSGELLIFGNGDLLQSRIRNYKRMAKRRVVQNLTVTYQTSSERLEQIPAIVKQIVEQQSLTRFDRCHFLRFQDSSLEFELVYWVDSPDFNTYADRAHGINIAILKEFNQQKIEFAHPTRTLFLQPQNV